MKTIELNETQIATLIDILQDDCVDIWPAEIDYTDADHMQFLAIRAKVLQILRAVGK